MTAGRWVLRRLLPALLLVAGGGILAGLFRGFTFFLPGITGMIAGGILGWMAGRLSRDDPGESMDFGLRAGFALGAGVFFETAAAVTLSLLHTGAGEAPLSWLSGVLAGYQREPFFGFSGNSLQSVSGGLDGGSWLAFVLLDLLLFAALFLVSHGAGSSPDEESLEGEGEEDEGEESGVWEEEPPLPAAPDGPRLPGGGLVFGIFLALSLAAIVVPQAVVASRTAPAQGAEARRMAARLRGPWTFGPEASFLGKDAAHRSFTLAMGPRGELAGAAAGPGGFLISLSPRRDGSFDGRLSLPRKAAYALHGQSSAAGDELRLVLTRELGSGPPRLELVARRPTPPAR